MRLALVQFRSSAVMAENLKLMERLCALAAKQGANLICFPEMAYLSCPPSGWRSALQCYADVMQKFARWAKDYNLWLLPGTVREPTGESGGPLFFNTQPIFSPELGLVASYRKIFLFQANLTEKRYRENEFSAAGKAPVVCQTPWGKLGVAICFDLRFPELFRALKKNGAEVIVLPSAFTVPTGKAHWEPLIRARAIENQFFIAAPAQTGMLGSGDETYGHSLCADPWGQIVQDFGNHDPGVHVVDLSLKAIAQAESRVPAWHSRREDLFPIMVD